MPAGHWLVIEALDARSEGGFRIVDRVAVVEVCADEIPDVLVDTGAASTVINADLAADAGIYAAGAVIDLGTLTIELA